MAYCGKCGTQLSDGTKFCPKCGKTVNGEEENTIYNSSKPKVLYFIIIALALAAIGAWLLLGSNSKESQNKTTSTELVSDSEDIKNDPNDVHSEEFIRKRIEEFCNAYNNNSISEEKVIEENFSKEFRKMYKTIYDLERSGKGGDGPWYSGGFLDGSSDIVDKAGVGTIQEIGDKDASADIIYYYDGPYVVTAKLILEDGNWFIDDMLERKKDMKVYIDYLETEKESSNNLDWLQGHWVYEQGNYKGHLIIQGNTITQYSSMNPEHVENTYRIEDDELFAGEMTVKLDLTNHRIDYGDGNWMRKVE